MLTRGGLIALITDSFSGAFKDPGEMNLQSYRKMGWIEEQDELGVNDELDRRTAARIIHMFMKKVLDIRDLKDIKEAYRLRDIFDCRVCAGHIAEVYLRGIIKPIDMNGILIFDVFGKVSKEEAEKMMTSIKNVWRELKSDIGE